MNLKILMLTAALTSSFTSLQTFGETIESKIESQGDSSYVKVMSLMSKSRNGFLSLQIEFANSDYKSRNIYYRVKWLDETGFQVWDDETWKPVLIQGSSKQNLQVIAPTMKAKDFRVQFNAEDNRPNDPTNPN